MRDDSHLIHFLPLSRTCKSFKFVVIASLHFTLFGANLYVCISGDFIFFVWTIDQQDLVQSFFQTIKWF